MCTQRCLDSEFSRKIDLWTFLDSPRSRIMKYPVLIKEVKKQVWYIEFYVICTSLIHCLVYTVFPLYLCWFFSADTHGSWRSTIFIWSSKSYCTIILSQRIVNLCISLCTLQCVNVCFCNAVVGANWLTVERSWQENWNSQMPGCHNASRLFKWWAGTVYAFVNTVY